MDMKDLLSKMTQLNEAKEANYSPSYRVGKTGDFSDKPHTKRGTPVAGKVGKYGKTSDELGDPDQDPDDDTPASAEKRGRGRPKKAGGAADTKDKYSGAKDLQNVMIGKMPKTLPGKKGTVHKSPQDKEVNESTKKKSLKDWVERVEQVIAENTAMPTTTSTATAPNASQKVIVKPGQPAGQKPPATMTTQTGQTIAVGSADQVKKLGDLVNTGQVQLTKPGTTQPLDEEGMEEGDEKWIKGAIKHPGAFTKKAKSHGMSTSSFANKVLSNKEDYPASTEKQANLAKTLGKLRKKTDEADIPPNDSLMSPISEAKKKADAAKKKADAAKKDDKAEKAGKKVAKDIEYDEKVKDGIHGKKRGAEDNKAERAGKKVAKDIEYDMKKKTVKEAAKPDFPDIDNDGNTKESMKKAAADKKKKAVKEGRDHHLRAAYHEGKAHGLSKQPYNCRHDDMEEARQYHEGYKCGLDECYGQQPILGYVGEESQHDVVDTMASYGAHGMEEGVAEGKTIASNLNDWQKKALKHDTYEKYVAHCNRYDWPHMDKRTWQRYKNAFDNMGMQGVAEDGMMEGSSDTVYPNAEVIKSKNGMPIGEIYQDGNDWGCFHYRADRGYDMIDSREDAIEALKDLHQETGRSRPNYTIKGMAEDGMEEGNAFTGMLAKTPKGGKFSVGGNTFTDTSDLGEMAFESWDKQLTAILEGKEVNEGMTVSISKGQQGSPDSVSVSAQDGEADQLLGLIKSAGLGLFGGDESKGFAPGEETPKTAPGGIEVVDDHDGMMALMKKLTGGDTSGNDGDYEEEEGHDDHEGHDHEEECNECGYMESDCQCDDKEMVDEVESEDQMTYNVAEDNPPDSGAAETTADENAEAEEDQAIATDDEFQNVNEWANQVGEGPGKGTDAGFEQDIAFMTKVISGGLNKQKATGQTTIPVIANQGQRTGVNENFVADWKKLAGIK